MRKMALECVLHLARQDRRVLFIGSDLGTGTMREFQQEFPKRFFMEGISEANIVGMAAGMAMEGKIPFVNTIASFLTRRAYEQVLLDCCLHRLPVRLIGNGGGLVYAPLGPTHTTVEDLAIMRAIPGMTVLAPCDAQEMRRLMPQTLDWPGPVYIRLGKGFDPVVSREDIPCRIGRGLVLREGSDVLLVTTGITLKIALAAAGELESRGIGAAVLHLPTVKPLDRDMLLEQLSRVRAVVSVEEHSVTGGLGSVVAETLAEADWGRPLRLRRVGIPDTFPDAYGSQDHLLGRYGIDCKGVLRAVGDLLHLP